MKDLPAGAQIPAEFSGIFAGEEPIFEGEFVYDSQGRKVEEIQHAKEVLIRKRIYSYGASEDLIEEFGAEDSLGYQTRITFELDSQGNRTEKLVKPLERGARHLRALGRVPTRHHLLLRIASSLLHLEKRLGQSDFRQIGRSVLSRVFDIKPNAGRQFLSFRFTQQPFS